MSRYFNRLFAIFIALTAATMADNDVKHLFKENRFERELNERDYEVVRQFVNSKRTLDLQEKSCNLSLSGDVRTEYRYIREQRCHRNIRGQQYPLPQFLAPLSHSEYNIQANVRLDYIDDSAWGVIHLLFDNTAGVDRGLDCYCHEDECHKHHHHKKFRHRRHCHFLLDRCDPHGWHGSGTQSFIDLRAAYLGVNVYSDDTMRFDIELGRRHLYTVFDSRIQFLSRFDGVLLKLSDYAPYSLGEWYGYLGGFVIDQRVNHYGWITEWGLLNICNSCTDLKYSFIDWNKHGRNRCGVNHPDGFKFRISQITMAIRAAPEFLYETPVKLYGAFLTNHDAHCDSLVQVKRRHHDHDSDEHHHHREHCGCKTLGAKRNGWYAGITFGIVCGQGDWALDFQYQYVEANAIPDRDVSGIGRGNFLDESFTVSGRGNTNYQGPRVEFLFAVTDNLTIDTIFEHSQAIDPHIGGQHKFTQFEIEAIYAF